MTRKAETLHEGWGYFTIKKKFLKGGEQLVLEAKLSDDKVFVTSEKAKKMKRK